MSKLMTLEAVESGREPRPVRAIIHGKEGVGKTSFGVSAPAPIFIDADDGSHPFDTKRFPRPKTFQDVLDAIDELADRPHEFKTCVVDTLDEVERLIWNDICQRAGKSDIEDFGYGKGYIVAAGEWQKLIFRLTRLQKQTDMHVLLLGHTNVRTVKDPQKADHDELILRIHHKSAAPLKEWANLVGYAYEESVTLEDETTDRPRTSYTGKHLLQFGREQGFEAKSRYRVLKKGAIPLDWGSFYKQYRLAYVDACKVLREEGRALIAQLPEDSDPEMIEKATKVIETEQDDSKLVVAIDRLKELVSKGER